jgi:hypothetical protein
MTKNKGFLVNLSRGEAVQIDADEVDKVVASAGKGAVVVVRRGIINPSYFVSITPDNERLDRWWDDTKHNMAAREAGLPLLKSVFNGTSIGSALEAKQVQKLSTQ